MAFDPTPEQNTITSTVASGKNTVVIAVAGSGKTSTLRLIGEALAPAKALYLAFGKDIAADAAATFPSNVACKTAHAVALAWFFRNHSDVARKFDRPQPKPWEAPTTLGIPGDRYRPAIVIGERAFSQRAAAALAIATVSRFCHSDSTTIEYRHVPAEFARGTNDQKDFEAFILPYARKAWDDLTSPNGRLTFTHKRNAPDVYLKLWSLACPVLPFATILFDEAQDADPAIAHVIRNQPGQIVMVGDPAQAIYGWRGAVDAMTPFSQTPGTVTLTLTQSFRFGEAIATEANRFLALLDSAVETIGNPAKDSTLTTSTDADAILCRTNAACIEYAMDAQARGKTVAICGGIADLKLFVESAAKIIAGKGMPMHADLAGFDSWGDVREAAQGDGADASFKRMVKLIDQYGTAALLAVCEASENVSEADADVIISTAHKAKGREWDSVLIANDFVRTNQEDVMDPSTAELMLMYVAITRAKLSLNCTALDQIGVAA